MKPHQLTERSRAGLMNESTLDTLLARWDGPRWRWWALAGGVVTVALAAFAVLVVAWVTDQSFVPLAMLALVVVILGGSLVGSGFIDSLTSRMTRGGLARESTDLVEATRSESEREKTILSDQEARDRRTIRAGLFILGPMAAFVYLLVIV
jgi:hypothetical protein